jgi:putative ABC transport system ATP-binding protein
MAILEAFDLTRTYGMGDIQVRALDGVSLSIEQGEFVAVMGPSGSGKSTLMNILGCLDRPTSGRYLLDSIDVSEMSRVQLAAVRNERIGFVFQSYNLLPRTSALKNVLTPLLYERNRRRSREEREQAARQALEAVGLGDRLEHLPQELSGGQQQRAAIARALVNDPAFILADEPTGNLDSASGEEILGLLQQLHGQGRTIMIVTHDHDIAAQAQRTIHLRDGRLDRITQNGSGSRARARAEGRHDSV